MKAEFKISIIRHKNFSNSVSNMPLVSTEQIVGLDEWERDNFEKSLPMSTYLVAFAISNFKTIKINSTKYNIQVEVSAKPEAIENGHGDYALDEASRILDFFSDYFDTKYPLLKSSRIFFYFRNFSNSILVYKNYIQFLSSNSFTRFQCWRFLFYFKLSH